MQDLEALSRREFWSEEREECKARLPGIRYAKFLTTFHENERTAGKYLGSVLRVEFTFTLNDEKK